MHPCRQNGTTDINTSAAFLFFDDPGGGLTRIETALPDESGDHGCKQTADIPVSVAGRYPLIGETLEHANG